MMSVTIINTATAKIPIYTECSAIGNYFPRYHSYVFKLQPGDETAYDNYYWLEEYSDAGFNALWTMDPSELSVDSSIVDSCQYPSNRFGRNDPDYALEELLSDNDIQMLVRPNITRIYDNGDWVADQDHTTDWKSESIDADDDNEVFVWEDDLFGETTDCGGGEYGPYPDEFGDDHFFIDPDEVETHTAFLIGDAGASLDLSNQSTTTARKKALSNPETVTIYLYTYVNSAGVDSIDNVSNNVGLLTLYSMMWDDGGYVEVDHATVTVGTVRDNSGFNTSVWYEFVVDLAPHGKDKAFALKWQEPWYEGPPPLGEPVYVPIGVGINRIRYEGECHENLFKYDQDGKFEVDTDSSYWERFNTAFQNAGTNFNNNILGYMGWEPWEFAYEGTRMLTEEFNDDNYDIYHQFSMYGAGDTAMSVETNPMYKWLNDNEGPGTAAMAFDAFPIKWQHWEYSYSGDDSANSELSIQRAWDDMINIADGADLHPDPNRYDYPHFANMGLRQAAKAAHSTGKELWAGIQASGSVGKDEGVVTRSGHGEPTPNDVKCQGFLAMTFGAKGFFYSYGISPEPPKSASKYYAKKVLARGGAPEDSVVYNGYRNSGLRTFWGVTGGDTTHFESYSDFITTRDAETGVLVPNDKWWAAKEFNEYVHRWEGLYSELQWINSVHAVERAPAGDPWEGLIRITGTARDTIPGDSVYWEVDPVDDRFVQVGIFERGGQKHFMLVNRRVDSLGTRKVNFTVIVDPLGPDSVQCLALDQDGVTSSVQLLQKTATERYYEYILEPGEGRLFLVNINADDNAIPSIIDDSLVIRGDYFVNYPVIIDSGGDLRILPGSSIYFFGNGSITNEMGSFLAVGKADSTILFTSLNSDSTGSVELESEYPDSLVHCRFVYLSDGLQINKDTASVYIDSCYFENNGNGGVVGNGGNVDIRNTKFVNNGTDGCYLYDCDVVIDNCDFSRNAGNGLYLYNVSSSSTVTNSTFSINGTNSGSSVDGNIRFMGCSPILQDNLITLGVKYGLYGANFSYPVMYTSSSDSAKNTVTGNADHETCWSYSYPMLDYGHNNFNTEDDTILYVSDPALVQFYARGNYWGGGAPDTVGGTGQSLTFYNPSQTTSFYFNIYDSQTNSKDAQDLLIEAIDLEGDEPEEAMELYQSIIGSHGSSSAAPIAVERLFGLTKSFNDRGPVRMRELDNIERYFSVLSNSPYIGLAKKAKRTALWALAAQNRFDEAIEGFEDILDNAECLADSVFAVIDLEALHLEAREWARRDTLDRVRSILFGTKPEIAPVNFRQHREHTDELLALLNGADAFNTKPIVPDEYFLAQNYPNPFNSTTKIQYGLPVATHVTIRIFDIMGREVATVLNKPHQAGFYTHVWSGKNKFDVPVSSGVYFYRIETPNFNKVKKMTLIK